MVFSLFYLNRFVTVYINLFLFVYISEALALLSSPTELECCHGLSPDQRGGAVILLFMYTILLCIASHIYLFTSLMRVKPEGWWLHRLEGFLCMFFCEFRFSERRDSAAGCGQAWSSGHPFTALPAHLNPAQHPLPAPLCQSVSHVRGFNILHRNSIWFLFAFIYS